MDVEQEKKIRNEERERIAARIEETKARHEASEDGVTLGEACLYDVCAIIAREGGLVP